jgi:hypothetical protein
MKGVICMTLDERIKHINDHFKNLTVEEFEKKLIECGIEVIKPASLSGMRIVNLDELNSMGDLYDFTASTFQISVENLLLFQKYDFCEAA